MHLVNSLQKDAQSDTNIGPTLPNVHPDLIWDDIRPENISTIKQLHDSCFPIKYGEFYYKELLKKTYKSKFLFNIYTNECVGLISGRVRKEKWLCRERVVGYISTFGVHKNWRRRGLGRTLMAVMEEWLFSLGAEMFELHVHSANVAALTFYFKAGYQSLRLLKEHYSWGGSKYDAVHLRKFHSSKRGWRRDLVRRSCCCKLLLKVS